MTAYQPELPANNAEGRRLSRALVLGALGKAIIATVAVMGTETPPLSKVLGRQCGTQSREGTGQSTH